MSYALFWDAFKGLSWGNSGCLVYASCFFSCCLSCLRTYGVISPLFAGIFYGFQAAGGRLDVRAVHRIGGHALNDRWLWGIALFSGIAQWLGLIFLLY